MRNKGAESKALNEDMKMISHEDYKKKQTPAQRLRVDELARQLIAAEKLLRETRGRADEPAANMDEAN